MTVKTCFIKAGILLFRSTYCTVIFFSWSCNSTSSVAQSVYILAGRLRGRGFDSPQGTFFLFTTALRPAAGTTQLLPIWFISSAVRTAGAWSRIHALQTFAWCDPATLPSASSHRVDNNIVTQRVDRKLLHLATLQWRWCWGLEAQCTKAACGMPSRPLLDNPQTPEAKNEAKRLKKYDYGKTCLQRSTSVLYVLPSGTDLVWDKRNVVLHSSQVPHTHTHTGQCSTSLITVLCSM